MITTAIIIARMTSNRLPGKVMMPLADKPTLQWCIERCRKAKYVDQVVVATVDSIDSKPIFDLCDKLKTECIGGDEHDVLKRVYDVATKIKTDNIIEITADCPLIDPNQIDLCCYTLLSNKYYIDVDYVSNIEIRWLPDGFDVQVYTYNCLSRLNNLVKDTRFHVGTNIFKYKKNFLISYMIPDVNFKYPSWRLTLDTIEDYQVLSKIFNHFKNEKSFYIKDIIKYVHENKYLLDINKGIRTKNFEEG